MNEPPNEISAPPPEASVRLPLPAPLNVSVPPLTEVVPPVGGTVPPLTVVTLPEAPEFNRRVPLLIVTAPVNVLAVLPKRSVPAPVFVTPVVVVPATKVLLLGVTLSTVATR